MRPYKLPYKLVTDKEEVDIALVSHFIAKHESFAPRYKYLEALYKGFHDVYNKPEKEEWKPDVRMAVNFPKYLTDTFMGYGYGIPVKREFPEEYKEAFSQFDDINTMEDEDFKLIHLCCQFGHCYEYFYQNEDAETRVIPQKPIRCFVVYEDSLRGKAVFGVRYAVKEDGSKYGEYFTPEYICEFENNRLTDTRPNPYGKIPLVEYILNDDRISLYEEIAPLVETYNNVIDEKANDVEAFAEAYLAIIGAEVDEEDIYRIRDDRVINLYGTDDAKSIVTQFLTKPTADGTQENLLDRIERLIYHTSMVANYSDETFGNASGTSLAYKLLSMSNLALTCDRKMQKSMSKRYKLFCTIPNNNVNEDAWKEIKYTFSRNVPKNLKEEAEIAQSLEGVVSKDTQLKVLSIVDNIDDEKEKINGEYSIPPMTRYEQ